MSKVDVVNNPCHYKQYGVEVIKITSMLPACLSNIVKYLMRSPYKGNEIQDLRKAQKYWELFLENKSDHVKTVYTEEGKQYLEKLVQNAFKNKHSERDKALQGNVAFIVGVATGLHYDNQWFINSVNNYINTYTNNRFESLYSTQKHLERCLNK